MLLFVFASRTLTQQRVSRDVSVKAGRMPDSWIRLRNNAPLWPPTKPMAMTDSPARDATRETLSPLPPAVFTTSLTRVTENGRISSTR